MTSNENQPTRLVNHSGFRWLWSGQTVSVLGSQFSNLALPVLAVTVLGATEWQMGILNAASTAAFLLVGLIAGAWVDRWVKRKVMIVADLIRFLTLLAIPVLWWFHVLAIWQLFVVAAVTGLATVFFDVASQSFIPVLMPKDKIGSANSALETSAQVAHVGGPSLVGFLIGLIQIPLLFLFDAISFAVSSATLLRIKDHEVPASKEARAPLRQEIAEGIVFVVRQKLIRTIALTTSTTNFFSNVLFTLLPLFILRTLSVPATAFGFMMSMGAIGGLVGAALTSRLIKWFGEGPVIVGSAILSGLSICAVPLSAVLPQSMVIPLLITAEFVTSFTVLTYNITQVTARQRLCPPELLGRMNASIRFFVWGVMPLGSLLGGLLGATIGVQITMWIGGIGSLVSAVFVTFSPLRKLREISSEAV